MRYIPLYATIILWMFTTSAIHSQENVSQEKNDFEKGNEDGVFGKSIKNENQNKRLVYDYRTRIGAFVSGGFVDLVGDDDTYGSSPISVGRSTSTELGINWKTRVFEKTNFMRVKYGLAMQWNKIAPRGNKYLVDEDGINILEEFPLELKKSLLRFTNVVVPVYLEFGPSKKIDDDSYISFSESRLFKIGFGGYAGLNIGSMQKLKYKEDGIKEKHKIKRDYNTTDFVYGVGAYIGYDFFSLFAKYDLSPLFKDQVEDKHLLSLGLRIDFE